MNPLTNTTLDKRQGWTSASNAEADELCPGRHLASRDLPDSPSSDAERGDRLHAALARQNAEGLELEERELFERCQEQEIGLLAKFFGAGRLDLLHARREQRLWITTSHQQRHSGQPDALYRDGLQLLILDYKTGRQDVADSTRNSQLRDLAVLAWKNNLLLGEIGVALIQPLSVGPPEICLYRADSIRRAWEEMLARIGRSNHPEAPRVPGETQCRFCRAATAGICPEYAVWGATSLPVPLSPAALERLKLPLVEWRDQDYALFLDGQNIVRRWLDERLKAAEARLTADPASISGWKIKPGTVRETINNPQTVFEQFASAGGAAGDFLECVIVGKTKLRRALAQVTALKGKPLDKMMARLLEDCVARTTNKGTLTKIKPIEP